MQKKEEENIMVQGVTDEEKTFDSYEFGLDKRILKALHDMDYSHPTLVQEQCIPLVLAGKDILVKARTGSGKTVAYAVPSIQKLLSSRDTINGIKIVVLVPSKELCMQTHACFKSLTKYCSNVVNCVALYDSAVEQQSGYINEYTDVVIATPKLLLSHLKLHSDNILKGIHTFIVDEADMLLSFGYEEDVNHVIEKIPSTCQNIVLSATLSDDVTVLKQKLLHNCVTIKLKEENSNLNEFYINVNEKDKPLLLYALLRLKIVKGKVIIFVDTLELGYYLYILLTRFSLKTVVLNNELPALSRNNIIYQFNRGMFDYLIATDDCIPEEDTEDGKKEEKEDADLLGDDEEMEEKDADLLGDDDEENEERDEDDLFDVSEEEEPELEVHHNMLHHMQTDEKVQQPTESSDYNISRGIDFENVSGVINYNMPLAVSHYIHRIGRTARAGNSGTALSFIETDKSSDKAILAEIQKYNPPRDGHPIPERLPFNIKEIESFNYRVDDVKRSITKKLIKETRVMELRREALNSSKLRMHFEDNPQELKMLQHAASKKLIKPVDHLKDIPDYLIPEALKPQVVVKDQGSRREKSGNDFKRSRVEDPLHSFAVTAELLNSNNNTTMMQNKKRTQVSNHVRIPMSGRKMWESKHKKQLENVRSKRRHAKK